MTTDLDFREFALKFHQIQAINQIMIANPDYNPHWEVIHDYHDEHRTQLEKEMRLSGMRVLSEDYKKLHSKWQFHHEICTRCLDTFQHETVQNFAQWLFGNSLLPVDESFIPPFESFRTMEEVRQAWSHVTSLSTNHEGVHEMASLF